MVSLSALNNNPIFSKPCPKDNYKTVGGCQECGTAKSGMKSFKNCGFCGGYFCTNCIPKKRRIGFGEDIGELKGKSKREKKKSYGICVKCEKLYLEKWISDEFINETNATKAAIGNLECDLGMLTQEYKDKILKINEITGSKNGRL